MISKRIQDATRVLGAPPDWKDDGVTCMGLPIRDIETTEGHFMVSAWEPTPAELEQLRAGASLLLWVRGTSHPVVSLTVD